VQNTRSRPFDFRQIRIDSAALIGSTKTNGRRAS
jgi:hypothetical protein